MMNTPRRPIVLGLVSLCLCAAILAAFSGHSLVSAKSDPEAISIRVMSLPTNDIVFNPADQKIYASIPSSDRNLGNTITAIDPYTGVIGTSTFIGSDPTKLAISNDGETLYAFLSGAFSVVKLNVATQVRGGSFPVIRDPWLGVLSASDLAISPDDPNVIALARQRASGSPSQAGVAIFNAGTQLPNTGPGYLEGANYLAFGANGQTLFGSGGNGGLTTMSVTGNGVTVTGNNQVAAGSIKYDSGKIFTSTGQVFDASTRALLGTLPGANSLAFAVEMSKSRAYFISKDTSQPNTIRLSVYDLATYTQIAGLAFFGSSGEPSSLIRWGTNGLAFRTTDGKLMLMTADFIPTTDPIPPLPPLPTPSPSPTPLATFVRTVNLPTNDIVFNSATGSVIATVPSYGGPGVANTLTYIDPSSGRITNSVFIGSEPGKIAPSDDGVTLYTTIGGATYNLSRFNALTATPGAQYTNTNGYSRPEDLSVMPGNPDSVALSGHMDGATIFDNGVARPMLSDGGVYSINSVAFSDDPTIFYGYENYSSGFRLVEFKATEQGVTGTSLGGNLVSGYNVMIQHHNGLIYATSGRVIDPRTRLVVGTFQARGQAMAIDPKLNRIFFVEGNVLSAFDLTTFVKIGSSPLPFFEGVATSMHRWGVNGLVFRSPLLFSGTIPKMFIVQSSLVSSGAPVPSGLQLTSLTSSVSEGAQTASVTVTRTGETATALSVDYATANGTAAAGADFSAATGTLNFAPGEASKTISIPLIGDNIYEGSETFTVTFSNAQGPNVEWLGPATATVTISENDQRPSISGSATIVAEPRGANQAFAEIPVQLSNPSMETITVNYATAGFTATSGVDFVAASGTLTFQPLEVSKTVRVQILPDNLRENNEVFRVTLSGAVNGFVSNSQVNVTIENRRRMNAFDFDGDGKAERSVFRPGSADWWTLWSGQGDAAGGAIQFGLGTDKLVPADYTGDGITDVAVWRPADGMWYILRSEDGSYYGLQFGVDGDIPVPADYDGDGRADVAVFRPLAGIWYIIQSSSGQVRAQVFGGEGDLPVAGDYDGDGRDDLAIWRNGTGDWWLLRSRDGLLVMRFGTGGDKAVPADFTGDGATDVAIFRPSTGYWYILRSGDFSYYGLQWGGPGDVPGPADYDGDGAADPTVWRPSGGGWWTLGSRDGFIYRQWGVESDSPVPAAFVRE